MGKFLFRVNKERWEDLVKLRGWDHPITALAKRTGFNKSLCSQAVNGGIAIGQEFMLAIIKVSGNDPQEPKEWGRLFEIVKDERPDSSNYQKDNNAKYEGLKPYKEGSLLGQMRIEDKAKNLERLNQDAPIPAIDFYHDAMPKRYQSNYRYKRG